MVGYFLEKLNKRSQQPKHIKSEAKRQENQHKYKLRQKQI